MAYLAATTMSPAEPAARHGVRRRDGSFAVEAFGVQGLEHVTPANVHARVRAFKDLVHFDMDEAPPG